MAKLRAALLFFAIVASAEAEWTVDSAKSEPGRAGAVHRHVAVSDANDNAVLDLAMFSSKACALRVIDNKDGTNELTRAVSGDGFLAGVNGGYFDPNFAPIGLRIISGKTIATLVRARLVTGVLFESGGRVQIARTAEFPRKQKVDAAIQCGPFLVEGGQRVRGLDNSRSARRTFVLTGSGDRAALGVCSGVSLAQLSEILSTVNLADDLKVQRALNLDGGSSTAFWFDRPGGSAFSISEQKNVRDFVAIVPGK